jgi:hypothetical protein
MSVAKNLGCICVFALALSSPVLAKSAAGPKHWFHSQGNGAVRVHGHKKQAKAKHHVAKHSRARHLRYATH